MEQKSNAFLETEKVGRLMRKYSIPCVISLLVAALYNIVDQIFIANADYLGSYGNAANTVVFPLTVVALAFAVMIGDGCCAFVSISLGRNQKQDAHKSVGNAIVLCVIVSLVLTAVYLIFMDPILTLFGGRVNDETFACAQEYFFWIALGIPFYMFGQAMNPIIRSDGSPKFAMGATLAGAVANLILDPIFIFAFRWGMMGAAVATVLGQILTAALSIWYLRRMKAAQLERSNFGLWGRLMKKFLPLGITSFLAQISLVISMAVVQNVCTQYGAMDPVFGKAEYAQIPLAVLGIVMKFFQIVISIAVGMAAGCIPVVGYNVGAGRKDRAKKLFYLSAGGGGCRRRGRPSHCGGVPRPTHQHLWRRKRKRLLYGLRRPQLPHLPLHDGAGHGEQGHLHLFAGPGQGRLLHHYLLCKRGSVRRGVRPAASRIFRAGRLALLLPRG